MTDNLKKFTEAISGENKEYLDRLVHADREELIKMAKEKGITITNADFEEAAKRELSFDELEAVAGGDYECLCGIGGGGTGGGEGYLKTCACVLGGAGLKSNNEAWCWCALMGAGYSNYCNGLSG